VDLIAHARRLQVLMEVADRGSFTAAAAALLMTQSAVSQHVAALERETATLLVERGTRPVVLTEAGQALTRHTRAVIARLDRAEQEIMEITGRRHGRLRLGSFPTALATFVPSALATFQKRYPEVTLTVVDDHLQRLLPRLADAELDLAIVFDNSNAPTTEATELERAPLFDDPYRLALPAKHRLARTGGPVDLEALRHEAWIGGGPSSAWFRIVRRACADAGYDPSVTLRTDDYLAAQSFVAAGMGIAVIPGLGLEHPISGIEVRPLRTHAPVRRIWVARLPDSYPSPAAQAMTELLRRLTRPRRALP
jgi:DNA-binding transcriptional LysR family regulator